MELHLRKNVFFRNTNGTKRTSTTISPKREILLYTLSTEVGLPTPWVRRIPRKTLSISSIRPNAYMSHAFSTPSITRKSKSSSDHDGLSHCGYIRYRYNFQNWRMMAPSSRKSRTRRKTIIDACNEGSMIPSHPSNSILLCMAPLRSNSGRCNTPDKYLGVSFLWQMQHWAANCKAEEAESQKKAARSHLSNPSYFMYF